MGFEPNIITAIKLVLAICSTLRYYITMLLIRKLIWDAWNIQHIARHQVEPSEIEAVCYSNPLILQGQQKGRLVLLGKTDEERVLGVVLEPKGQGKYYPLTAYNADEHDIALYYRLRGGENNETDEK